LQAKESAATMLHDILSSSAVATKRALANRAKAEAAEAARKAGDMSALSLIPLSSSYAFCAHFSHT
jgi:hypothetical protein